MRKVHYVIKLLVCFALIWTSLTMAVSRLNQTALSTSAAARSATTFTDPATASFIQQPSPGQWIPTSGPEGGIVTGFANIGGFLLAATLGGGVFRSSDGGASWAASNTGLGNLFVNALAIQGLLVFAATNGGVYRSADNGASWTPLNTGLTVLIIVALLVNGATLYAGSTGGGVFVSTSGGQSWTPMNNGLTNLFVNSLVVGATAVFAGTGGGVFRLLAGAAAWTPTNVGLTRIDVRYLLIAGAFIFAATGGGVFRSNNDGGSWLPVNVGLGNLFVLSLAFIGRDLYAATQDGLYRSTDNGASWTEFSSGLFSRFVRTIFGAGCSSSANAARGAARPLADADQQTCTLIAGLNGGGVYLFTNNQGRWNRSNRGLMAAKIRRILRLPGAGPLCAATIGNGVHCSSDNGRTWSEYALGLTNYDATSLGVLFLSNNNADFLFLCGTNNGVHYLHPMALPRIWTRAAPGITNPFITDILSSNVPNGSVIVATSDGVFLSRDPRVTWIQISDGLPAGLSRAVLSLAESGLEQFAGTSAGVYRRPTLGGSWSAANEGLPGFRAFSLNVTGSNLFAGSSSGVVFRRPVPVQSNLPFIIKLLSTTPPLKSEVLVLMTPRIIINDVNFGPDDPISNAAETGLARGQSQSPGQIVAQLVAGTYGEGVFVSNNNGDSWREINSGLNNPFVMSISDNGANLLAGTDGGGLYLFAPNVASVSAASFSGAELAAQSIVAAFGAGLATATASATTVPLPTTLAGTRVTVKDSAGVERAAPIFFAAPTQINFQLPPGTAAGAATISITSADGKVSAGAARVASVAPGLFSANASGQGVAAGAALRVKADGSQSFEPIAQFDPAQNRFVAVPIDLGPDLGNASDQVFLILFGTGLRFRSSLSGVSAKIGGSDMEVLYAGEQGGFVGLDQVNLRLARSLAGRGEIDVAMTVDGKAANALRINVR